MYKKEEKTEKKKEILLTIEKIPQGFLVEGYASIEDMMNAVESIIETMFTEEKEHKGIIMLELLKLIEKLNEKHFNEEIKLEIELEGEFKNDENYN